ncbi:Hypothetical predicted protein [Olea europaea subsp. europaea]|uniref:Uncharacterized protein n=1 Tax=Olea europaea subsp. europaea TaxID=158383 RepID=A0A8S0SM61_OLEEU|nr:Hypothetical predicted protein [Olea europaea subsp. europaea]
MAVIDEIFVEIPILIQLPKTIKETSVRLSDAVANLVFQFVDQSYIPAQSNFALVEEIDEAICVSNVGGSIPDDFPEGVYIRNGRHFFRC